MDTASSALDLPKVVQLKPSTSTNKTCILVRFNDPCAKVFSKWCSGKTLLPKVKLVVDENGTSGTLKIMPASSSSGKREEFRFVAQPTNNDGRSPALEIFKRDVRSMEAQQLSNAMVQLKIMSASSANAYKDSEATRASKAAFVPEFVPKPPTEGEPPKKRAQLKMKGVTSAGSATHVKDNIHTAPKPVVGQPRVQPKAKSPPPVEPPPRVEPTSAPKKETPTTTKPTTKPPKKSNTTTALRLRVMHLLAPAGRDRKTIVEYFRARYGEEVDEAVLDRVLSKIAVLQPSKMYELDPNLFDRLDLNYDQWNSTQRRMVVKQMEGLRKEKDVISPLVATKTKQKVDKLLLFVYSQTCTDGDNNPYKMDKENEGEEEILPSVAPSKDFGAEYPKIDCDDEYFEYRQVYENDYPKYVTFWKKLQSAGDEFDVLGQQYEKMAAGSEEKKLMGQRIGSSFEAYRKDTAFAHVRQQNADYRAKLTVIKARLVEYEKHVNKMDKLKKNLSSAAGVAMEVDQVSPPPADPQHV